MLIFRAWSDYLPGSNDLEADWVTLKYGNYNKVTKKVRRRLTRRCRPGRPLEGPLSRWRGRVFFL